MPVDELPMYPTPQQAAYVVGSPPGQRKHSHPKPNVAYRPPKQYPTAPQGYQPAPQHLHQQPPPPPAPQQQYYQPQPTPQPPVQHYSPSPAQPQYAPTPQQYYQPQPLPQSSHFQQHAPQSRYDYQPQPQHQDIPQHHHQPPPQLLHQPSPQPQQHQQYSVSSITTSSSSTHHKKPPPSMTNSPPQHHAQSIPSSKPNRSKETLVRDNASLKPSAKQKLEHELRSVFDKVDSNGSGKISAKELSSALLNFDNTRFQESTVLLMIRLFSSSSDVASAPLKSLNFDQFVSLWKYLSAYKKLFVQADTNKSGDISFGEFQKILEQIGYKLNIDLVLNLFQKFSYKDYTGIESGSVGKLKFDAFIELLVYLRKLTDVFKKYDKDLSGVATISFADFLFEVSNIS